MRFMLIYRSNSRKSAPCGNTFFTSVEVVKRFGRYVTTKKQSDRYHDAEMARTFESEEEAINYALELMDVTK